MDILWDLLNKKIVECYVLRKKTSMCKSYTSLNILLWLRCQCSHVFSMCLFLLSSGLTKAADITTAKAVKGTCPDMCPEKVLLVNKMIA